ncbi:type IV pilin protein [Acinetobacter sp. 10FS3-1]|uniref:type IV pilin protein n=1 Tax=Acinetobacter sp. 10FS3-1 TaxID=2563897 RepID=UPI00157DE924|nr:type IV pilin protein [Acinetobacter sp. 10FS3-1]QKQ70934.1 prepilin-type N-terminal cleavage/methylation domain-containing protein [Acinetobacter sp. 10FS3-1]
MVNEYKKGFTLIELMIVVMVIAIIAAIAFPSYQSYIQRSVESAAKQRIQHIANELEKYKARQFNYLNYAIEDGMNYYPTSTNAKYTFSVKDGDDTDNALTDTDATGRSWVILATPSASYPKLQQFVMTSTGLKCKKVQGSRIDLDCNGETSWTD